MENNFDDVNNNSNNNNNKDEGYLHAIIAIILFALLVFGNLQWFVIAAFASVLLVPSSCKLVLKLVLFIVIFTYLIAFLAVGSCVAMLEAL